MKKPAEIVEEALRRVAWGAAQPCHRVHVLVASYADLTQPVVPYGGVSTVEILHTLRHREKLYLARLEECKNNDGAFPLTSQELRRLRSDSLLSLTVCRGWIDWIQETEKYD